MKNARIHRRGAVFGRSSQVSEELSDILSSARGSAAGQRAEGAHSEGAREQRKGLEARSTGRARWGIAASRRAVFVDHPHAI